MLDPDDALSKAQEAVDLFENLDDRQLTDDCRLTAIMYALVSLAESNAVAADAIRAGQKRRFQWHR